MTLISSVGSGFFEIPRTFGDFGFDASSLADLAVLPQGHFLRSEFINRFIISVINIMVSEIKNAHRTGSDQNSSTDMLSVSFELLLSKAVDRMVM